MLQNQYKSVFSTPLAETDLKSYKDLADLPAISSFNITHKHILDAINEIKSSSSCPKYNIPAKVLKECKLSLCKPLKLFWERSFKCKIKH